MADNSEKKLRELDWSLFIDRTVNITMNENYGVVYGTGKKEEHSTFYEIVFKTGKLISAFDDALFLEAIRDGQAVKIWVPFSSIKCVEIF